MKTRFSLPAGIVLACAGVAASVAPLAAQNQTISSATNQSFIVGDSSTAASAMTITDNQGSFNPGHDIYIVIPAALSMIWDNTVTTVTITGSAAAKVSTTPTYTSNSCVQLSLLAKFVAGDQIVVSGLKFNSFTAAGGPEPAGTANGYVMLLVGLVTQVLAQEKATAVIVDDDVASFRPPPENCVDVIVAFQPVSEMPSAELSIVRGTV